MVLGPNWTSMDYIFKSFILTTKCFYAVLMAQICQENTISLFQFLKVSVKANLYFEPWVGYPTTRNYTSTRGKYQHANFNMAAIFLVIATVKTRPVLKRACQELSAKECTYWKRSWGPDEKLIFSNHDSKI